MQPDYAYTVPLEVEPGWYLETSRRIVARVMKRRLIERLGIEPDYPFTHPFQFDITMRFIRKFGAK